MTTDSDETTDPGILAALALASEGTDYFERTLAALGDDEFAAPSLLPGWSRAHVIAHVGYNAEGLGRLADWASTGVENPMYVSSEERAAQIEEGTRLTAAELRDLNARTSADLNNTWRGLSPAAWRAEVRMVDGTPIRASSTIWMRTREVWLHAVDLDSGAGYDDFPDGVIDHLLANVLSHWRARRAAENIPNFVLVPTDREASRAVGEADDPDAVALTGTAADLARWATGRGAIDVATTSGDPVPAAPHWI
jgi:maleylpyruvate isomerase